MFKELNNLKVFIENPDKEVHVREYAKSVNISPATAMKLLNNYKKQDLLICKRERGFLLYRANKESDNYIDLKIYYNIRIIRESGLIDYLNECYLYPTVILFGSFIKGESIPKSDIDLCIISKVKKEIILGKYEKRLKHKIQLFNFKSFKDIKNINLKNSILNGVVLVGNLEVF